MAKLIMICGKICAGKSTYAKRLQEEWGGMLLSVDELLLALLGGDVGEMHNEYAERARAYLFELSAELTASGINVILDWGFWTVEDREQAKSFCRERGIPCELHYLAVSDRDWKQRIRKRNQEASAGKVRAYLVDEGLAAKCAAYFVPPDRGETDVWMEI